MRNKMSCWIQNLGRETEKLSVGQSTDLCPDPPVPNVYLATISHEQTLYFFQKAHWLMPKVRWILWDNTEFSGRHTGSIPTSWVCAQANVIKPAIIIFIVI